MGCTAIVLGSQANVCLTPYSYSKWRTNDKDTKESMKWTSATTDDNNKQWKTMGWYPAPTSATVDGVTWIEADPMNCITECQMNCTAAFTEQAVMLKRKEDGGCLDCLINCTHPWGKNIEECHLSPDCTDEVPRHKGIKNFCLPVARCFQVCAGRGYPKIDAFVGQPNIKAGPIQWQEDASPHDSDKNKNPAPAWTTAGYEKHGKDDVAWYGPKGDNKKLRCMMECEYDGKLTVGFGITAMVLVWLAPLALIIGSGPKELRSICSLVFAVLFWAASLILCTDALLLNMMRHEENNYGGRGWDMLYYERLPTQYDILGGEGGHLKVTFNWMMHVIFGFGLMCNLFTVLAFYDSKEIWNRRTLGEEPEPPRPPSPPREPPKPKPKAMSYYGEEQAKEDEIMNAGAAGLAGTGENQFNVDIGLRWERRTGNNGVDETVIKEIVPGGAADKANNSGMNGTKNRLQPGYVLSCSACRFLRDRSTCPPGTPCNLRKYF